MTTRKSAASFAIIFISILALSASIALVANLTVDSAAVIDQLASKANAFGELLSDLGARVTAH